MSPRGLPSNSGIALPPSARAPLIRILLEAGIALTPATSIWNPSSWFAVLRYAESFSPRSAKILLVPAAAEWDARLTGVLAEEIGVGVAAFLAREYCDVVHIADVLPLIQRGEVTYRKPPAIPKNPEARPDWLALDRNGQRLFVEAKGVVGTESRIAEQLNYGKGQVLNVDSVLYPPRSRGGQPCADRLVFGTHICIENVNTRSETTTIVRDPPSESREMPQRPASDLSVRIAYAKVLNLADEAVLADLLVRRLPWPEVQPPALELVGSTDRRLVVRLLAPFLAGGMLAIHDRVWNVLAGHHDMDLLHDLGEALEAVAADRASVEGGPPVAGEVVLLNNGVCLVR